MVKSIKDYLYCGIFLILCFTSFLLFSKEVEIVEIDTKIIKKSMEETSDSLPTVKFYPASISEIQILSVDDLVVYIKSLHTERELLAKITLLIDNKEIESRDLKLLPGEVLPVEYKLKDSMLSKHTIKVILDFEKPKDLRNWEEFVMFKRKEETISFNFEDMIKIPFADFKIKIDGNISDWEGKIEHIFLGEKKDVYPVKQRKKWQVEEGVSGKIYLAWDKDYFYIAAVVKDDKHLCTKSRRDIFEGDFLKCEFTPYLIGRKIAPRIFELALLKDVVDMDIYNIRKGRSLKQHFKKCEYVVKRNEVKKETIYEIKIPLMSPLLIKGEEGEMVDFNMMIFDSNDKIDKYWLQLIPEVSPDPQYDVSTKCVLWR